MTWVDSWVDGSPARTDNQTISHHIVSISTHVERAFHATVVGCLDTSAANPTLFGHTQEARLTRPQAQLKKFGNANTTHPDHGTGNSVKSRILITEAASHTVEVALHIFHQPAPHHVVTHIHVA